MFKKIGLYLFLTSLFFLVGCNGVQSNIKESKELKESVKSIYFDNKIAVEVAKEYINAIKENNIEKIKELSNEDIDKNIIVIPNKEYEIIGIKQISTAQMGNKTMFKFNITRSKKDEPKASLEEYYLEVMKTKEGNYKVSKLKSRELYNVFSNKDKLKIRKDDEVEINTLIDLKSIPNKIYPKVNVIDIAKVDVPKEKFSVLEISFSGDKVAISTYKNEDSYIGVVEVEDAKETLVKEGEEEGKEEKDSNKLIGKKITSLDVLRGSKITSLHFSEDDGYVIVNYIKENNNRFKVYKSSGEIVYLELDDIFNEEEYNLIYERIEDNNIIMNVTKASKNNGESNLTGRYKISLKDFKLKKL